MILGIDASNIRAGGGLTHLVELLRAADPLNVGFHKVIVWSCAPTLARIEDRPWLEKKHRPILNRSLIHRALWQRMSLSREARAAGCDLLFVPGGSFAGDFRPMATFHQNLLPFDVPEIRRFGLSLVTFKLLLLRLTQSQTFRRADGVMFLTEHARDVVIKDLGPLIGVQEIIPHGVDQRFHLAPRPQLPISSYSLERPFRLLYVSQVDLYKHQWHVAEAAVQLRKEGLPVTLDLVGRSYPPALEKLRSVLDRIDPCGDVVRYSGPAHYEELHRRYMEADLAVFASSCETFGQILTEAMSAGVPIACSNRAAMPELLGEGGLYFEPEDPSDIAGAIRRLIESPDLRARTAAIAFARAQKFTWKRCADETMQFMSAVVARAGQRKALAECATDGPAHSASTPTTSGSEAV